MKTAESTLIFAERAPVAASASTTGKRSRRRRRRRGTSMVCRTGTDEVAMPGDDYELMLEDAPDLYGLGRARAAFEAGGPVAAQCALEGNAQAKVLFELDSAYVIRSHGGNVAQAVAAVTDWANLGAAEYEQQAGVELINEIYVDMREGETGSSYDGRNAISVLRNFRSKWRTDPELSAKAASTGVVHLISGMDLPDDEGVLGIAYVASACDGAATAISWVSILDSMVDQCKVALMMHETGHTLSLRHVNDESAVMNPINTCSTNFQSQSRAQIKNYVQANAGSFGCSCAESTPVSPPPPPPPPPPPRGRALTNS